GNFEFQDEGSQLLSEIISPTPGNVVIDACAGAGGKTLHLAALMQNRGTIRVFEPYEKRMQTLFERAREAGVTIARELPSAIANGKPGANDLADVVFLDVPCSGSGTFRRSPELKWRLSRDVL